MKSINEKAEEYTSEIKNQVTNNAAFLAYKEGANYVLGEVEMLLNSQRFVDNPSQELFELIEQLKK